MRSPSSEAVTKLSVRELRSCHFADAQLVREIHTAWSFDRRELKPDQWHSKRCVLVGDAVHPTSLQLGQRANQALKAAYSLHCHSHHASNRTLGRIASRSYQMPFFVPESDDYENNLQILGPGLGKGFFAS